MENAKIKQCKNSISIMLMYYYEALKEIGSEDPKQEIATEIANMMKLTDKQKEYILEESKANTVNEILKHLGIIISKLEKDNSVDKYIIKLLNEDINLLKSLIK